MHWCRRLVCRDGKWDYYRHIAILFCVTSAALNSKLLSEVRTAVSSGYFTNPINFTRIGNKAFARVNSPVGWSFSNKEVKLCDFPEGFTPKYDKFDTIYRGAEPFGRVEARTTGLYAIAPEITGNQHFAFDVEYFVST